MSGFTLQLRWEGGFIEGSGKKKLKFQGASLAELRAAIAFKCGVEDAVFNLSYHDTDLNEVVDLDDVEELKDGLIVVISERLISKRQMFVCFESPVILCVL